MKRFVQKMKRSRKALPYDSGYAEKRRWASIKVASQIERLTGKEVPYLLQAVPSWLIDYVSNEVPIPPPVDIIVPDYSLLFSMAPKAAKLLDNSYFETPRDLEERGYSSIIVGEDRKALEHLIVRRLMLSSDAVPIFLIFCDPDEILKAITLNSLICVLNTAYHESIDWCLSQMPPVTQKPELIIPGSWASRRLQLEEMRGAALFEITIPYDAVFEDEDV